MQDKHSYKGWLNSDSFLKRVFGVWGYYCVANLIISVSIGILMLICALGFGISFSQFK